eukprot:CAMPEP_0203772642 /NCGR_PEP_ID=MMETSP0099_2-20121227/4170_1 /ASSEMBLY_ACC=CAM_ASM_000209 /TAXON_ID=96639 /ORGANISM=" , Strain NY0313808BC1" /LENGTH=97 /DNA_ID=CAMNT_0050670293 /DNA_START=18 /DNA_END=312 /DNA_ORIENTATION=+
MIPNYMATAFKGLGAEFSKQVVRAPTGQNFIIGGGGAGVEVDLANAANRGLGDDVQRYEHPDQGIHGADGLCGGGVSGFCHQAGGGGVEGQRDGEAW